MRGTISAIARLCGGLLLGAALVVALTGSLIGIAPAAGAAPSASAASQVRAGTLTAEGARGSVQACAAYVYTAIRRHRVIQATPAACAGLSRAQVNQSAGTAIRMAVKGGSKPDRRRQAATAGRWARALITDPGPVPDQPGTSAATAGSPAGAAAGRLGLGGIGELAAKVGALLAWLATAVSGGWVLARWLLAGGSLLRRTATAAPPVVTLAHVGVGLLGVLLWSCFMISGWIVLAWIALGMLAPVSGLGMGVLVLGLPRPVRPPLGTRSHGRRPRFPVLAVAAHGLFAFIVLLLVLLATIGAA